jgi:hypothetical protein
MGDRPKNPYQRRAKPSADAPATVPERRPGLRKLPNDLAELADGRVERLRRPPRAPEPIEDERIGFVVPGVRNLEARAVYDVRVTRLRAALASGDEKALGQGLCDAMRMTLWRARNVTDFAAFADSVVGVKPERAQELARVGAEQLSVALEMLPAQLVALWIRVEAALLQACPQGRVSVSGARAGLHLQVHVPAQEVGRAIEGFADMGVAASGLRRFLREDGGDAARARSPRREEGKGPVHARAPRGDERPRRDFGRGPAATKRVRSDRER